MMMFFKQQYPKRKRAARSHTATGQASQVDDEERELREILTRDISSETLMEMQECEIADGGQAEHDEAITNSICQQAISEMAAKYGVQIPPSEAAMALKVLPKVCALTN